METPKSSRRTFFRSNGVSSLGKLRNPPCLTDAGDTSYTRAPDMANPQYTKRIQRLAVIGIAKSAQCISLKTVSIHSLDDSLHQRTDAGVSRQFHVGEWRGPWFPR